MSRDITKPTKWVCAQPRLRSAWASAQSDQEFSLSAWRNHGSLATHHAHSEGSDQTGWMLRLIWVVAGRRVNLLVFRHVAAHVTVALCVLIHEYCPPYISGEKANLAKTREKQENAHDAHWSAYYRNLVSNSGGLFAFRKQTTLLFAQSLEPAIT